MKSLLLYNSFAGKKKNNELEIIKSQLAEINITPEIIRAKEIESTSKYFENENLTEVELIIVCGGDGTLYQLVNGFMKNKTKHDNIKFAVIPFGTGNAFARDLNIVDIQSAVTALKNKNEKLIDLGEYTTENEKLYFINILGFGFVADANKTSRKYRKFGNSSYTFGVLEELLKLKTYNLEIEIDGKSYNQKNIFVEISNSRYTGKDFLMAPEALIDDGLLDITILKDASRFQLIKALPKIFTGEHVNLNYIETHKAKQIKIKTDEPKLLTPDGELIGSTPITVNCIKGALTFISN